MSTDLLTWLQQAWAVISEFYVNTVPWQAKALAVIMLIIGSMKVTVLNTWIWSKLGTLEDWAGPVLGLLAGILNTWNGGQWTDVVTYVFLGAGAMYLHDLLDLIKLIPGLGSIYVALIDIIENIPIVGANTPAPQTNTQAILEIADKILEGAELVAAQTVWAEAMATTSFLTWPILGPFLAWVYFQLVAWMSGKSVSFMNWFLLGFAVAKQKSVYDTAVKNLQQALANGQGDPNALQQASSDFDNALQGLVNSDLPPQ